MYSEEFTFFCEGMSSLGALALKATKGDKNPVKTVVSAWGSGRKGALGEPVFEGLLSPL